MILDGALQLTGTAGTVSADSPTTGTQQSTNVVDLLNARDMGIGDDPALKLLIQILTTFTGGTSLQVLFEGSVDNSTYTTMWSSPVIVEAALLAGRYIANIDLPRIVGATPLAPTALQALPRYYRLEYVTVGTHGAGGIYGAIVLDRQDQLSYPPGIVINN